MPDKEILDKIRRILENDEITNDVKIANIYGIIVERYKYYMKPWYVK